MINLVVSFLMFLSGLFILLAALGLKRFPDLYCRMHATTMASTIAKIFSFLAVGIFFWHYGEDLSLKFSTAIKAALSVMFLFVTAPLSAHLIARAGYKRGARPSDKTWRDDYAEIF